MMYPATIEIYERLISTTKLKVFTEEVGDSSAVWLQFTLENGGSYRIRFISKSDGNDVAVRVFSLITVREEQAGTMLKVLNDLNKRFRFLKFVLDDHNNVQVEYDFTSNTASAADSAEEIIIRIVQILKDAYPEMMRALWV